MLGDGKVKCTYGEELSIDDSRIPGWKTLQSPLDCKGIQPIHPKGDQSWVFIGRSDIEAEMPILWPYDAKN